MAASVLRRQLFRKAIRTVMDAHGLTEMTAPEAFYVPFWTFRTWYYGRHIGAETLLQIWWRGPLKAAGLAREVLELYYPGGET